MEMQMPANVCILQTRPQQQSSGMDRATRNYDFSAFHNNAITLFGSRFDAGGEASVHANTFGLRLDQDPRAMRLRVREPRLRSGLFRADGTAIPAVSANLALFAADDVARHRIHMPAKPPEPKLHHLFTAGNTVVVT